MRMYQRELVANASNGPSWIAMPKSSQMCCQSRMLLETVYWNTIQDSSFFPKGKERSIYCNWLNLVSPKYAFAKNWLNTKGTLMYKDQLIMIITTILIYWTRAHTCGKSAKLVVGTRGKTDGNKNKCR